MKVDLPAKSAQTGFGRFFGQSFFACRVSMIQDADFGLSGPKSVFRS
jgi:hypothetical protein